MNVLFRVVRQYLDLLKKEPAPLAYGALHYFFSAPGQTFFLSLFVPYFLIAADVTNDKFNQIYLIGTLLSAFTLPWVGGFIDKWRIRYVSLSVGGGLMVFGLLASQVNVWWMLIPVIYGLRLFGQGLMPLTGSTSIARYFSLGRGKALSLINFGISFAELIFPLLVVTLIGIIGWQWSWVVVAGIILATFVPLVVGLIPARHPFQYPQEEKPEPGKKVVRSATRKEVLRDPLFYMLTLVQLFVPFFSTGFMLNQSRIGELVVATPAQMALGISLFGGARMVCNLLAGPLIDRYTATRVFTFLLVPVAIGLFSMTILPSIWTIWVFFTLTGIAASIGSLSSTAMWAEIYGTANLGAIKSTVSTFMVFSTAIGPVVVGLGLGSVESFGFSMGITALVVIGLITLGFFAVRMAIRRN